MSQQSTPPRTSLWDRFLIFLGVRNKRKQDAAPPVSPDFYSTYSTKRIIRIKDLKKLANGHDTPDYISPITIEGQNTERGLFVLGKQAWENSDLDEKFMRIDRMFIPDKARMVNPDILKSIVKNGSKGEKSKAIDPNIEGLLYKGEIKKGVLLDVCGMVKPKEFSNMPIHSCEGQLAYHQPIPKRHSTAGYQTCPDPLLAPSVTNSLTGTSEFEHKLIIFHMPYGELIKPQGCFTSSDGTTKKNFSIAEILKFYFNDKSFPNHNDPTHLDWEDPDLLQGGIFLIPMTMPDNSVSYYCILNIDGESNRRESVIQLLNSWFDTLDLYNRNQDNNWIGIAGNDASFCYIEDWSIYIGKNAQLLTNSFKKIYKPEVLESLIQ